MDRFGGPIIYLIVYSIILFAFLVWFDSGSKLAKTVTITLRNKGEATSSESVDDDVPADVKDEASEMICSTSSQRMNIDQKSPIATRQLGQVLDVPASHFLRQTSWNV